MSNIQITGLPAAITAVGTDQIEVVAAGVSSKMDLSVLASYTNGAYVPPDMGAYTIRANPTSGSAAQQDVSMSGILDFISSTRGTVLYRGASGWTALSPGTSGYYLSANGAGADPSWKFSGITVSATAPSSPSINDIWIDIS